MSSVTYPPEWVNFFFFGRVTSTDPREGVLNLATDIDFGPNPGFLVDAILKMSEFYIDSSRQDNPGTGASELSETDIANHKASVAALISWVHLMQSEAVDGLRRNPDEAKLPSLSNERTVEPLMLVLRHTKD